MTSAIVGARPQMPCGGKNPRLNHAQTFMPLIQDSSYRAPSWLPGGHVQTIYPALFRRVARVTNRPERLELLDGDFVDLEWADQGRARLAILSHGLEATLQTGYIQGMAAAGRKALERLNETSEHLRTLTKPGSPARRDLDQALADVSEAAQAIRSLADFLERNPETIIQGRSKSPTQQATPKEATPAK